MLLLVDDTTIIIRDNSFVETHAKLQDIMQRQDGVFNWANKHNCKFSINKFQLLDLSRKSVPNPLNPRLRNPIMCCTLVLGNHRILSKESAKFLGIMVDNKLNWKDQVVVALAKGHMWLMQFGRITRTTHGLRAKCIRCLYLAITIPRILYAADIFLTPQRHTGCPNSMHSSIKSLASIQHKAALMITGALGSTANNIIDSMADLLPFYLLVENYRYRAALQLVTLPTTHPLQKPIDNATKRLVKKHPTPLHDLMHQYNIQLTKLETIKAIQFDIKWRAQVTTSITPNTDIAISDLREDNVDAKIFTDGSGKQQDRSKSSSVQKWQTRQLASIPTWIHPPAHHL